MKKIFLFLLFCLSFGNLSVHASEQSRLETLFGKDTYYFSSYDTRNLDTDILRQKSKDEDIYPNAIQMLSKTPEWKKKNFTDFVKALSIKDTKKAAKLLYSNWQTIDPFTPTCCSMYKILWTRSTKNGILALSLSGNGAISYNLSYIYYKEGFINRIFFFTGFQDNGRRSGTKVVLDFCSGTSDCIAYKNIDIYDSSPSDRIQEVIIGWFMNLKSDALFFKVYDNFITDMTKFMKQ